VEIVDLSNNGKTCSPLPDYPFPIDSLTAVYYLGAIFACSGNSPNGTQPVCFELESGASSWREVARYPNLATSQGASVIDNQIIFTGGSAYDKGLFFYEQGLFTPGPILPFAMYKHCQLTINDTHIFIGGYPGNGAMLFEARTGEFTFADNMRGILPPACGFLNGIFGEEILLIASTTSQILNLNSLAWRAGPSISQDLEDLAYAQVSGGFVTIGGLDNFDDSRFTTTDNIYKCDENTYKWTLLEQKLTIARSKAAAVAVPPDFLTCL